MIFDGSTGARYVASRSEHGRSVRPARCDRRRDGPSTGMPLDRDPDSPPFGHGAHAAGSRARAYNSNLRTIMRVAR